MLYKVTPEQLNTQENIVHKKYNKSAFINQM